jgi:hypothetical protein
VRGPDPLGSHPVRVLGVCASFCTETPHTHATHIHTGAVLAPSCDSPCCVGGALAAAACIRATRSVARSPWAFRASQPRCLYASRRHRPVRTPVPTLTPRERVRGLDPPTLPPSPNLTRKRNACCVTQDRRFHPPFHPALCCRWSPRCVSLRAPPAPPRRHEMHSHMRQPLLIGSSYADAYT